MDEREIDIQVEGKVMFPKSYQEKLTKQIDKISSFLLALKYPNHQVLLNNQKEMKSKIIAEKELYDDVNLLISCNQLFANTGHGIDIFNIEKVDRTLCIQFAKKALNLSKESSDWQAHVRALQDMTLTLKHHMKSEKGFLDDNLKIALENVPFLDLDPSFCEDFFESYSDVLLETKNTELSNLANSTINKLYHNWIQIGENMLMLDQNSVKGNFGLDYLDYFIKASELTNGKIPLTADMHKHKLRTAILFDEDEGGEDPIFMIVGILEDIHPDFDLHLDLVNEIVGYLKKSLQHWDGLTLKEVIKHCCGGRFNSKPLDESSIDKVLFLASK